MIVLVGVTPSPALIVAISIGSEANAPTISYSGLLDVNPSGFDGYLSSESTSLPEPLPYALESFA